MTSFGQQFLACQTPRQVFELEMEKGISANFAELDNLISELAARSLRGEQIVSMSVDEMHNGAVEIHHLTASQQQFIKNNYDFARQRECGSWTLPEKEYINVGWLNLTKKFGDFSHFPMSVAGSEICRVKSETSPEAVFLWSVFSPFHEKIIYPIKLRSKLAGVNDFEELKNIWNDLDAFYAALGITDFDAMNVFRFRGGWSKLSSRAEQLEAKEIASRIIVQNRRFYRHFLSSLCPPVFNPTVLQKAKSDGIVKRKQVITKAFQPLLTGFSEVIGWL